MKKVYSDGEITEVPTKSILVLAVKKREDNLSRIESMITVAETVLEIRRFALKETKLIPRSAATKWSSTVLQARSFDCLFSTGVFIG